MAQPSKTALFDWATVEPGFKKLLQEDLTPERVPEWLLEWNKLEETIGEAWSIAQRAKNENTADEAAEKAFLHLIQNIDPQHMLNYQALEKKLLNVKTMFLCSTISNYSNVSVLISSFSEKKIWLFNKKFIP